MSATWHWSLLHAGELWLDGGSMFGVVPRAIWSGLNVPDERNRIRLQTNCLLLDDGAGVRALVETGYGTKWDEKQRNIFGLGTSGILKALSDINVDPASVTHVIVTHLHFDHAGGLTHLDDATGQPVASFPNAIVLTQRTEWEDALANKSTMTRTYLRSHLDPIADKVQFLDGEREIIDGITVWPMPGHTWGQQAVRFRDNDGVVCFPGDVMPTINHAGLAFSMGYDMLPHQNMCSKQQLLQEAAGEGWRIVIDHEPDHPIVTVERDAEHSDRFTLRPSAR
jgi:glyoxylase-like metal-dependent hydrolase (beta-lactamase superfamily II)